MLTVHTPHDIAQDHGSIVTIGNFDGVHKGHQSLILRVLEESRQQKMVSVVVTFWPHPRCVVSPTKTHRPLSTREQRLELLHSFGIDYTLELPFTQDLANLSPREFVEAYLVPLKIRHLLTGYDFSLGRGRSGHTAELRAIGADCGFTVEQMPPLEENGDIISSTRLRALISQGNIQQANHLLGRPYSIAGTVVHGFGRGKGLGFPTANLEPYDILIPCEGVYAAYALADDCPDDCPLPAVVNIGRNPTFGTHPLSIEAYLLRGGRDLYEAKLRLSFLERLRDVVHFPSANALKDQIARDCQQAMHLFESTAGKNAGYAPL